MKFTLIIKLTLIVFAIYLIPIQMFVKHSLFKGNYNYDKNILNATITELGTKLQPFNSTCLEDIEIKIFDKLKREVSTACIYIYIYG